MAKKNNFLAILSAAFIGNLLLAGCGLFDKREEPTKTKPKTQGSSAVSEEPGSTSPVFDGRSTPTKLKVALILGPGGYKTFAHAGVIKELKKKGIPIHAVVGLEWGALVGALFAQRGQINEAEWKLYKLEKLNLSSSSFFSRKKDIQPVSILKNYLKENLNSNETSQTTIPFFCPSLSIEQGSLIWQEHGLLSRTVTNCISYPPVLYDSEGGTVAGLMSIDRVTQRLKNSGYNIIILVNVLGEGNLFDNSTNKDDYATAVLWSEVRRSLTQARSIVTDAIEVNTRGIGLVDFESRKLLVTAGEAAGDKAAQQIANKYGF